MTQLTEEDIRAAKWFVVERDAEGRLCKLSLDVARRGTIPTLKRINARSLWRARLVDSAPGHTAWKAPTVLVSGEEAKLACVDDVVDALLERQATEGLPDPLGVALKDIHRLRVELSVTRDTARRLENKLANARGGNRKDARATSVGQVSLVAIAELAWAQMQNQSTEQLKARIAALTEEVQRREAAEELEASA